MNFQIVCAKCGAARSGEADDTFQFISASRDDKWLVPDILENKPILCPTCKVKP
ncbi:MAG TPA: hypothetical protein VF748_14930 [Candidatus Acidoferrum sp.]